MCLMGYHCLHLRISLYALSIIIGTVALSYGSVPLYKTICQQTGWGGQPIKSAAHATPDAEEDIASKLTPVTTSRRLRITFAGSTSDILPWKFTPQQREVRVLPGETALAFYTATNKSETEDIIGVATYRLLRWWAKMYLRHANKGVVLPLRKSRRTSARYNVSVSRSRG